MMVRSFHISPKHTRIGAAVFSSGPRRLFSLRTYRTKAQVLRAVGRTKYPRGGTKTGRALNYVRRYMFKRNRRSKVLIVMTDGKSYDRVGGPANALKKMGVTVFSLGIGRKYKTSQLFQIASSRRHVFTARFRVLRNVVGAIQRLACSGR